MNESSPGELLRFWRQKRKLSQFDLALRTNVSARHLSFLETGRAQPSRAMLLKIAEHLKIPLRQRNLMLAHAGFAAEYGADPLDAATLTWVKAGLERVMQKHEPYPALLVDSGYEILLRNAGYEKLVSHFAGNEALQKYQNAIRILLAPDALRGAVSDLAQVENFLLARLQEEAVSAQNEALAALVHELSGLTGSAVSVAAEAERSLPFMTLTFDNRISRCTLFSTITTLGTPADLTTQELRLELFFPADSETQDLLERL